MSGAPRTCATNIHWQVAPPQCIRGKFHGVVWAVVRLIQATWLFGRIFSSYALQLSLQKVFPRSWTASRWPRIHRANSKRMYQGFVRLRGVYIKLGQILSVMGSFLPKAYMDELKGLQDNVPHRDYSEIQRAIHNAFGKPPSELFKKFDKTAIAAASLGQVHRAITHENDHVAVKVMYPNIATIIQIDLRVLRWTLQVYRHFFPVRQIERVHEQLKDMLERETDLSHEADCLIRMKKNFEDDPDVLFPDLYPSLSNRHVMTMSYMDGAKISHSEELHRMGLSPDAVATKLVDIFYKQLFFDSFFHADPHPGNFFVQRGPEGQPRIVVLDLGSATPVSKELVNGMLDVLAGVITEQDILVITGIEKMGFLAADEDHELLKTTVRTYFAKLMSLDIRSANDIYPKMVEKLANPNLKHKELRELMKSVEYPQDWFFVERAIVILFGLASQLAPTLNVVRIGFPYVMKVVAENNAAKKKNSSDASRTQNVVNRANGSHTLRR